MEADGPIRLIVTGNDFGLSHRVNRSILRAHQEGILTCASLMVNESGAEEAVAMAMDHPDLGVGLHLSLIRGKSTLKPSEIRGVVDHKFRFTEGPIRTALRYAIIRDNRIYLRQEIDAQIRRFRVMGLPLEYLDGHLHFHQHPTVFGILKQHAFDWRIPAMRLVRDPLLTNLRLAGGRYFFRVTMSLLFSRLSRKAEGALRRRGIRFPDATFGLLQDRRITEKFLVKLLSGLHPGTFELYCHPDSEENPEELRALCSPRVREVIDQRGIELIRYRDLYISRDALRSGIPDGTPPIEEGVGTSEASEVVAATGPDIESEADPDTRSRRRTRVRRRRD
jgi:hopanoid biosynthesis associated protein HpnK